MDKFKNYPVKIPVFDDIAKKHGKKICGAPFSSLIFEANGGIKFCCMAGHGERGNIQGNLTNLNDIINSPKAMEIRKHFLDGTMEKRASSSLLNKDSDIDSYCDTCWDLEQRHDHPADPRHAVTEWSQHVIDDLVANTDANGYMHKIMPAWLDIVFSNKCNFACMGCTVDNSTTIGKYLAAYETREGGRVSDKESLTEEEAYASNVDADGLIDHIIEHQDSITHIHFQGGEPFMMPEVYKTLDKLIEHDLHKPGGIYIWCHTNGSIRSFKGEDIIEKYLKKWENRFQISMSHDGCGSRGEYIRYGYKDKKWLETFHRVYDSGCRIGIQHSINIFNVLHQEECLNWYWENCLSKLDNPAKIGLTINPWGGIFKFDNIKYIPSLAQQAVQGLKTCRDMCQTTTLNARLPFEDGLLFDYVYDPTRSMFDQLGAMFENGREYDQYINSILLDDLDRHEYGFHEIQAKPPKSYAQIFTEAVTKFDEMRGTDFHKIFPELRPFWDFCNNGS